MTLYLNLFTLLFITVVFAGVMAASKEKKLPSVILNAILLIPILSQVMQVLFVSGHIVHIPYYVVVVYILLRLLGPLINWHVHLLVGRPIRFFSPLNSLTYAYIAYVLVSIVYLGTQSGEDLRQYTIQSFQQNNLISAFYPVLPLAHVAQASWLLFRGEVERNGLVYFMRIMLVSTLLVLVALQVGYFVLDRPEVELVLVPILFCVIYSVIAVVSIRYSALHNNDSFFASADRKSLAQLSARESEVLQKLSEGKTDKQIASEIYVSPHTVRTYCKRIYSKLEIKNRTEAAIFYRDYR